MSSSISIEGSLTSELEAELEAAENYEAETFSELTSKIDNCPSTSTADISLAQTAQILGNYVSIYEDIVSYLSRGRNDNIEALQLFRDQHEYVIEAAKKIYWKIADQKGCEVDLTEKNTALQELRQYLTRLQMAQCSAASYLGSLWYSLSDPDALKFESRAHFLIFEQRRKEAVRRLEETIQEMNRIIREMARAAKCKNVDDVKNKREYINHRSSRSKGDRQPEARSSRKLTKEEEEILPMLMPNQNYVPASRFVDDSTECDQDYFDVLPKNHHRPVILPLHSNTNQSLSSVRSFLVLFRCSTERTRTCFAVSAIVFCIGLAGLVAWILTEHTEVL